MNIKNDKRERGVVMYNKHGIDYRPENCYLDDNRRLLISATGLNGFAIYTLLLDKIYGEEGYFVKCTSDLEALFAMQIGTNKTSVSECIKYLLARNFFDKEMYNKYKILTSLEIQQEYERVTTKRVNQWHTPQYVYSSILSRQNDGRLKQNDSNQGNIDNGNNTEKRTAKQSESKKESKSYSESENDLTATPAVLLSQKLNKELKNPKLKIDTNEINIDALCNAVLESDFLQKAPNLNVDWLVKHYKDVIGGKYKNIEVNSNKNTAIIHQRNYTKEEMDNVFSNIDDWI